MESRRLRDGRRQQQLVESRDLWTRQGSVDTFRRNQPDGFLADFMPVPWGSGRGSEPGDWFVGSDDPRYDGAGAGWAAGFGLGPDGGYGPIGPAGPGWGPRQRTVGSPLTEYDQRGHAGRFGLVLPAVTRCLKVLVEAVVRPLWLYRDAAGRVIPRPLWVDDPMLLGRAPGPVFPLMPRGQRLGGHEFFSTLLADAILFGQGGFVFVESSDGTPLPGSLIPLNPFMFGVDGSGHVVLDRWGVDPLRTDHEGRFDMDGGPWRVAVLRGDYPNHDGWPEGVLAKHFWTFRLGAKLGRYMDDFFTTGIPSGYLQVSTPNFGACIPDPDRPGEETTEQELLKRRWMAAHGSGRRSVAVLNSTVSYTPISVNPVDADAVKLQEINLRDVAHAFGMSAIWLDIGVGGLTYSNSSERRADLVSMTAAGWGEKMMDLVTSLLPYGTRVEINWPSFVSPSTETMAAPLVQLVQSGVLTAAEARAYMGIVPWVGPDPGFVDRSPAAAMGGGVEAL